MSMHNAKQGGRRRRRLLSRVLFVFAAAVLFVGLFLQISMLARISDQTKQASSLEREIVELSASAENLQLTISQHHNLETIAARAQQLGMEQPDETQIRVVTVACGEEDTSIQTVEAIDGEKVLN